MLTTRAATSDSNQQLARAGEELFAMLDQDRDGALSRSDFTFRGNLRKLDLDADESVSLVEIGTLQNPFVRASPTPNSSRNAANYDPSDAVEFRQLNPRASLANAIILRYDRAGNDNVVSEQPFSDGMLDAKELDIATDDFSAYDRDGNQLLDFDELVQFLRDPVPDLEAVVWLESLSGPHSKIDWLPANGSLGATVVQDGLMTRVGTSALIVSVADPSVSSPSAVVANAKRSFRSADRDMNGYLEVPESLLNNYFRGRFEMMDRDGDKKVYEEEMLFIVEQQATLDASRVFATFSDAGRNLFQLVDVNRDGRVDGPEIAEAARLFPLWDHDHDDRIALRDIPRAWRLVVSRGQPSADTGVSVSAASAVSAAGAAGASRPETGSAPARGPVWFQRMDRNQDGRIMRREFLFHPRHFEKLDINQDGILDLAEASAAP